MKHIRLFDNFNLPILESKEDQLKIGIKIESEHCDIYEELEKWVKETYKEYASMPWSKEEFYKKIAEAHLREMPNYYTKLAEMEKNNESVINENKQAVIQKVITQLKSLSFPVDKNKLKAIHDELVGVGIKPVDVIAASKTEDPDLQKRYLITGPSAKGGGGNGALKDLSNML